jgi:SAM-dependent methyltransferase
MTSSRSGAEAALDPQLLHQMWFSFAPSFVLTAAVELDVFSHIAGGHKTAAEVARAAGASERGTRMLLDALAGLDLLAKRDGSYELGPLAAEYLVRSRPDYIGAVMESGGMVDCWSRLSDAIRSGKAAREVNQEEEAERFFPILIRSLHVFHRQSARRLAEALGAARTRAGLHALDVACGSGVWGIAIAEADPRSRVTAQDFPNVLDIAREYTQRHGVGAQFDFLPGDLNETDFGENRYDLALLGHLVHAIGEEARRPRRDPGHGAKRRTHGAAVPAAVRLAHAGDHRRRRHLHLGRIRALARGGGLHEARNGGGRRAIAGHHRGAAVRSTARLVPAA